MCCVLRIVYRHDDFVRFWLLYYHLGELICLVSTFPVNRYFINPPAPELGDEEGAAKSEEGIRIVPPTAVLMTGRRAGVSGTVTGRLADWTLRILGMVADKGIEALDFMGGRGVDSFSSPNSFLVCFAETRRVISFTGLAGRIIGDYHQLDLETAGERTHMISSESILQFPIMRYDFRLFSPIYLDFIHFFLLLDPAPFA